jgi:hypothetical protein
MRIPRDLISARDQDPDIIQLITKAHFRWDLRRGTPLLDSVDQVAAGAGEDAVVDADADVLNAGVDPAEGSLGIDSEGPCHFSGRADLPHGLAHGLDDSGIVNLSEYTQGLREVVGAEEDDVDVRDRNDLI